VAARPHSVVVGAGIVGICTALYLQAAGRRVTLIGDQPPGEGTSSGNAGIISTGSVHPEAMPGLWRAIPDMVLSRRAPVALRPSYAMRFAPWLGRFLASSSAAAAERSSVAIHALSSRGLRYLWPLVQRARAGHLLRRNGLLYIHETPAQLAAARRAGAYYDRRGVDYQLVDSKELQELEPALKPGIAGAVLVSGAAHTVSPLALSRQLFALFERQGGEFLPDLVRGFATDGRRVTKARAGTDYPGDEFFVTAGAWSHRLAAMLGSRVPLETERGYHQEIGNAAIALRRPLLFVGRGFAATSMQGGLRLAGTVEFAGLEAAPDYRRARLLAAQARELIPGLKTGEGQAWMGYRPSLPDSVPVLSVSPHYDNVYFGFGHGHLGLTQAAVTGAALAAMASGGGVDFDLAPYRIERFTRRAHA
jgi:D-amino-acid dehydrogenase